MMSAAIPMLTLLAVVGTLAAPSGFYDSYPMTTEKRAALVLDRLLIALQNALNDGRNVAEFKQVELERNEPRAVPLRYEPIIEVNDMTPLQRRGTTSNNRGRVLRCYFNAVTCF